MVLNEGQTHGDAEIRNGCSGGVPRGSDRVQRRRPSRPSTPTTGVQPEQGPLTAGTLPGRCRARTA